MSDAANALEAEVESGDDYVRVDLVEGVEVRVLPTSEWRASFFRLLREGDIDAFVQSILHEEDLDVWFEEDPRQREIEEFVERLSETTGQPVGKSQRSTRSSKGTRKK